MSKIIDINQQLQNNSDSRSAIDKAIAYCDHRREGNRDEEAVCIIQELVNYGFEFGAFSGDELFAVMDESRPKNPNGSINMKDGKKENFDEKEH